MKFIYADALDQIDPGYDFARDRHAQGRLPYWNDLYAHEFMALPPYDGLLVSRGIVGDHRRKGKYSDALAMRFRREGARRFLRLEGPRFGRMPIFGDCGAFSYAKEKIPPYSPDDTAAFYADCRFTHGCSVDHIIFSFRRDASGTKGAMGDDKERYDITLANAETFRNATRSIPAFEPLGVIQGWSPDSMALAASSLEKMGYRYLAVGGMVSLAAPDIKLALEAIRSRIHSATRLHLLGFAKAEQIHEFTGFGVASFDSTSPLYRAFMDAKANYYVQRRGGGLDYYTAIRIPHATEDRTLSHASLEGRLSQETAAELEAGALKALYEFDAGKRSLDKTTSAVMRYQQVYLGLKHRTGTTGEKALARAAHDIRRTLSDAPWKACRCAACASSGINTVIFRSSNRNKRRGFHNLAVYSNHLKAVLKTSGRIP